MTVRPWLRRLALLAFALGFPGHALAGTPFFARLQYFPNQVIASLKSASVQIKTSNMRGANGVLLTTKLSGARDFSNALANVTLHAWSWPIGFGCSQVPFDIPLVNGKATVKLTGTDVGISELNFAPGRTLSLDCADLPIVTAGGLDVVAGFSLFGSTPGTILSAPFIRDTNTNPITKWGGAKILVQNVKGDIVAKTSISGAKEGSLPSSRTIVVQFPMLDNADQCARGFFFNQSIVLEKGRGTSIRTDFDGGNADPASRCGLSGFGLTDSNSDTISDGVGIVQGVDPD